MHKDLLTLAKQLKTTEPDFYNGLKMASKVIEHETHTKVRVEAFYDVTEKPLVKVKVTIGETGETGETNNKGLCIIYVKEGDYTLVLERANYLTMQIEQKVKRGSNTVHVDMSPKFDLPTETVTNPEKVAIEKY